LEKKDNEKLQIVNDSDKQNLNILLLSQQLQAANTELELVKMQAEEELLSEKLKIQDSSIRELQAQLGNNKLKETIEKF
jgi:hypothetical protein